MCSGYVLLRSAAGVGVNTRLHDPQRHSWTISSFLRRVPFRLNEILPQFGQRSGRFAVCGTRAAIGATIQMGWQQRTTRREDTEIGRGGTEFWTTSGRREGHGFWTPRPLLV